MQPRSDNRIAGLDGIRAYAIALVFLVHFLVHYFNGVTTGKRIDFDAPGVPPNLLEAIAKYFWASHYGVDLFFLLSGFLIFRIVSSHNFSYFSFLRSRFFRLYPAFFVAVVLHVLYFNKVFAPATIGANLLMLHGIWELRIEPIILPTWSLSYEWLFYISFPALLLVTRSRISLWQLGICAILVLIFIAPIGPHYIRFLMFILGAALASNASIRMARAFATNVSDAAVLFVYVTANFLFVYDQNWYTFIPVYLFTSAALVTKVIYGQGFLHKVFTWQPLRRIGNISYSFYLFHGLAIVVFCDKVGPSLKHLPEALHFVALLLGSFALSLVIGLVSYVLLEKPYFDRKLAKPHERVRMAGSGIT